MKQALIRFVTFISGLYFFLEFVLPKKIGEFEFGVYHEQILDGARIVGAMAIGLGIINIMVVHGGRLIRRNKGALNSAALLLGFLLMTVFQGAEFVSSEGALTMWKSFVSAKTYIENKKSEILSNDPEGRKALSHLHYFYEQAQRDLPRSPETEAFSFRELLNQNQAIIAKLQDEPDAGTRSAQYDSLVGAITAAGKAAQEYYPNVAKQGMMPRLSDFLFYGFFVPLGASMFALLGFYIVSAAYNSFRARSFEAAVMLIAAVIVILGQIPQGSAYISDKLPLIRLWVMENLNTPANRAIYFGSAVAGLAMAVRLWLSLDKTQVSAEGEG